MKLWKWLLSFAKPGSCPDCRSPMVPSGMNISDMGCLNCGGEESAQNAAAGWKAACIERDRVTAMISAWSLVSAGDKVSILDALKTTDPRAAEIVLSAYTQQRYHRNLSAPKPEARDGK